MRTKLETMGKTRVFFRDHPGIFVLENASLDFASTGTLPETNIAPENGWLEYYFPFGKAHFQVLC